MSARICGRSWRILASTQKRAPAREPVALHVLVCSAVFSRSARDIRWDASKVRCPAVGRRASQ
jgi:hypothetical protein